MRALAALHERLVANLIEDSVQDISSRFACTFICDTIRSEAAELRCIGPRVGRKLVTVRRGLEPERVPIELSCDRRGAKIRLIDRLFLVLQEIHKIYACQDWPESRVCARA
jgi:hypothetical protein